MSVTIGTIAGSTGLGSERQVVQTVTGDLWAFQYTGTNVLSTWVSQDGGTTWSSGATHTLANAHSSEGRNLAVAYKRIGSADIVHIGITYKSGTSLGTQAIRATISGTTITFHSSETAVSSATGDGDSLFWAGSGLELDSNNKVHWANGWAGGGNGDVNASDSTADSGTAEQMTPVTWTSHVIDSSITKEMRSAYVVDLGSGNAGLICDEGTAASTTTALDWHTWNGSSWNIDNTNAKVTGGSISTIDDNDWGAVALSTTDVHVVYRSGSNTFVHRRWNGSNWIAGQTIPNQTSKPGSGVALSSDGNSVWLSIIDSDSANTVRYIRWTALAFNEVADEWESWQAGETSTQTRTFLGCVRDVVNANLLVYWSEGTSFVSVALSAPSPPDPPGTIVRVAVGVLGSAGAVTTLSFAWSGTPPVAGDKIVVGFWASFGTTPSITSVKDNATSQNTFSPGASEVVSTVEGAWIYWLDLPNNATWSGNYTVTVTFSVAPTESDGGGIAYSGVSAGGPLATNQNTATSTAATTGAVNSPSGNSLYFAVVTDNTGAGTAVFTWAAPFIKEISQSNGSTQQAGSIGDVINVSGSQNASITVDSSQWAACIAVWVAAPVGSVYSGFRTPRIAGTRPGVAPLPVIGLGPATFYRVITPTSTVTAPVGPSAPLFVKSLLRQQVVARRGQATVASPGPIANPPVVARTSLKRPVPQLHGPAKVAKSGPLAIAPTAIRELLRRVVPTPRGRASVAGVGPLAAPPLTVRERLLRAIATPRGRAQVASPVSAQPIIPLRERLVAFPPALRGRSRVAGPGPAQQPPTATRGLRARPAPALRSRAMLIVALPSAAAISARTALKRSSPQIRRGVASVAGAGPLASRPVQVMRGLLKFPQAIRRGFARVAAFFVPPPPVLPGTVTVADRQVNTMVLLDFQLPSVIVADQLGRSATITDTGLASVSVADQLAPQVAIGDTTP
jgi:hypothetical protein